MTWTLKLVGCALLLLGAVSAAREYAKYVDKNESESDSASGEAEKKKKIARALLIGGALAACVMLL